MALEIYSDCHPGCAAAYHDAVLIRRPKAQALISEPAYMWIPYLRGSIACCIAYGMTVLMGGRVESKSWMYPMRPSLCPGVMCLIDHWNHPVPPSQPPSATYFFRNSRTFSLSRFRTANRKSTSPGNACRYPWGGWPMSDTGGAGWLSTQTEPRAVVTEIQRKISMILELIPCFLVPGPLFTAATRKTCYASGPQGNLTPNLDGAHG